MNSIATVQPLLRGRLALIVAGVFALLGLATSPAKAGYYGGYGDGGYGYGGPCSYRCGYHPYYPIYHHHYGCYSCGPHLVYERRFVEREYVERRYGYGFHRHFGCYSYYRCHAGYYPYGGYHRPLGYYGYGGGYGGYGYGGVGRRWPLPFPVGYEAYDDAPPRPPAPIYYGDE